MAKKILNKETHVKIVIDMLNGLTQTEVANKYGIKFQSVSYIKNKYLPTPED